MPSSDHRQAAALDRIAAALEKLCDHFIPSMAGPEVGAPYSESPLAEVGEVDPVHAVPDDVKEQLVAGGLMEKEAEELSNEVKRRGPKR